MPSYYQGTLTFNRAGWDHPSVNVLHMASVTAIPNQGEADQLAAALQDLLEAVGPLFPTATTGSVGEVVRAAPFGQNITHLFEVNPGDSIAGAQGGGLLPTQLAIVASWRTGFPGRANRGRTYFGPLPASAMTAAGLIDPTFQSSIDTACTNYIANVEFFGHEPIILHRASKTGTTITSVRVGDKFDRQVRRKGRETYTP